jgi:radical SAM protein with 4Fe4S-binding SPASM domain
MNPSKEYTVDLVAFHITNVCTHRCPFCYAADQNIKTEHPPLNQLIQVAAALIDSSVKEITFLGGDPASYPDVVELAKYISQRNVEVSILSNTLNFKNYDNEEVAKYISAFETTIHHFDPEKHDEFCKKKGAYSNVIEQLRIFNSLGRRIGVAINIIPNIYNHLYKLVETLVEIEKLKLDYIIVQRIIPFGRASGTTEFTLTREQAELSLHEIQKIDKNLNIKVTVEDPFPLCILSDEFKKYMNPCQWGISKAAVNSKGDLSRCGADPRYRLGNILNEPLNEIWNNSPILKSFRSKNYLPGRCRVCEDVKFCGGGCPLSCELEKDHGIDYLFLEYEKLNEEIHGNIVFVPAKEEELSSILQIEWSDFPGYGHIFNVDSIKFWYKHNPRMFWVVKDSQNWVLGYASIVPINEILYNRICKGEFSSLVQFPSADVLKSGEFSKYYHLEVLASVPSKTASRAGRSLLKSIGYYLLENSEYVTASPVTEIGIRLCKHFNFKHVADECLDNMSYPIYVLMVDKNKMIEKIKRF